MAPLHPLGRELPSEILNEIMQLVLKNDRIAVLLPRQIAEVGAPRNFEGAISAETVITSHCAFFRSSKASRTLYGPMFRQKFLNLDMDQIIVKVEDFNIKPFRAVHREIRRGVGSAAAMAFPYDFHMSFTEEFLYDPVAKPLVDFIETWSPQTAQQFLRFMDINYTIKPIPLLYVDKLQALLNSQSYERSEYPDPEFKYLLGVFKELYVSREIVRVEDQDKNLIGNWVRGEFVVKEAHEWKGDELDEEDEPMIWFDE